VSRDEPRRLQFEADAISAFLDFRPVLDQLRYPLARQGSGGTPWGSTVRSSPRASDILPTPAEASVISRSTDTNLESLAGFRNRLVHDYFRLDRRRVHLFIRTRLDGFRLFAQDVARWLDSSPDS